MTPEPRHVPSADGVEVAVHDFGGSGPTLLIVHATGFCGWAYHRLATELVDRAHVLAPDLRGHGDSRTPPHADLSWWRMADDVLAVVDTVAGGGPVLAVGHSMGGCAVLLAELVRPGSIAAAWLFEPIVMTEPPPPGTPNHMADAARRRREFFESREAVYERYRRRPPFSLCDPDALRDYVDHAFADTPDGRVVLKCRGETEARVFEGARVGVEFADRLGEIDIPVTVVASGDGENPALIAPAVAAALPRGRLVRMDDLTHFGPFQDPARVAAAIAADLGLDRPAGGSGDAPTGGTTERG